MTNQAETIARNGVTMKKKVMSTLKTKLKITLVHLEMRGRLAPKNTKKRKSDSYHSILRDGRKRKFADFI